MTWSLAMSRKRFFPPPFTPAFRQPTPVFKTASEELEKRQSNPTATDHS
jgi:hypothetical protein